MSEFWKIKGPNVNKYKYKNGLTWPISCTNDSECNPKISNKFQSSIFNFGKKYVSKAYCQHSIWGLNHICPKNPKLLWNFHLRTSTFKSFWHFPQPTLALIKNNSSFYLFPKKIKCKGWFDSNWILIKLRVKNQTYFSLLVYKFWI